MNEQRMLRGSAIAQMLTGIWRNSALLPADAATHMHPALSSGLGGLLGRLVPATAPRALRPYREEYRILATIAIRNERLLASAIRLLHEAGTEPLLVKGLSVSRHYPDVGCRPVGDIDLCVRPGTLENAIAVLQRSGIPTALFDLHEGVPDLPNRSWDELLARSTTMNVNGVDVRILGPEDLLQLVCLHFVRHLGERPLWLCDVAVLLESMPPSFDWAICLSGPSQHARWVLAIIGLAHDLLGAVPIKEPPQAVRPPSWLTNVILKRWGELGMEHPPKKTLHPIRAAWRLGVGPIRSLRLIQLGSVLLLPVQLFARIIRRARSRRRLLPFDVHRVRRL